MRREDGAVSAPLLVALLGIAFMSLGTWGVMRRWRQMAELQLRLDRCAGEAALELKGHLEAIESANRQMRALRAGEVAAVPAGASAALEAALQAEVARQEVARARWRLRQARWLLERGCEGLGDLPSPLASMPWERPPPDALGPRPLRWPPDRGKRLLVQLAHAPRAAAAQVQPALDEDGAPAGGLLGGMLGNKWHAAWTIPEEDSGQSLIEALIWSFLLVCSALALARGFRSEYRLYRDDLAAIARPRG